MIARTPPVASSARSGAGTFTPHRSAVRQLVELALGLAMLLTAAGCSTASSPPAPSVSPSPTDQREQSPVGIIAIGHSGLTGESSDPDRPGEDARQNSWATGTNADVESVYTRMIALRPETQGHASNRAEGGAVSGQLAGQAAAALAEVPTPALAIIQTIDNDIRCDGTDSQHVPELGAEVDKALKIITDASPDTRVLVVGQMGRPVTAAAAIAEDPGSKAGVTGTGICDFFGLDGKLVPSKMAALTGIIEGYESEQARVCATYPQCSTDDGAFAAFVDTPGGLVFGHLTIAGHHQAATLIWPKVQPLLQ
jgi:hypothetical protein